MKYSSCILFLYIIYVSAFNIRDPKSYGPVSLATKIIRCNQNRNLDLDVSKIQVHFYDFRYGDVKSFPINGAAKGILSLKNLDKKKKFFMFVGGFKSNINKNTAQRVRDAFRNIPNSYLIIIDHSAYTHDREGSKNSYERSVTYVYYIGRQLAQMLANFNKGGISVKNMHCMGHSLGAQILGHVGENFIKATGQKISRISALDPAGPCYSDKPAEEHIRSGVADYVEVYHCNDGVLGTSRVLGDVDFFVNKGKSQPTCDTPWISQLKSVTAAKCNHKMCVIMWTESVTQQFTAYACGKYKDFKLGNCFDNDKTTAGFWNPGKATGVYYFSTKGFI